MAVTYPLLLAEVIVDDTNGGIRFTEDGTPHVATIAPGSYFLRGDGSASDLAKAIYDAFNAAGSFTYSTPQPCVAQVGLGEGNSGSFSIVTIDGVMAVDAAHASTTFDLSLIGYDPGDTDTFFSPPVAWIGHEPLARSDPGFAAASGQLRMTGGQVRTFDRGGPYTERELEVQFSAPERALRDGGVPEAAFETFWILARDGRAIEYHEVTSPDGSVADPGSSDDTLVGTFVFNERTCGEFRPVRFDPGLELYGWPIGLRGYV